jgi:low temperature requirement protein LtrA
VQTATDPNTRREPARIPAWLGLCLFLAIAAFFLSEEHRTHILGVVPYALLLLCPVIHLFMHRGHGGHGAAHSGHAVNRRGEGERS